MILLGLPHIVKAAAETWPNPRASFIQEESRWEMDVMPNLNFALSSNCKDQLRNLYNYLNQKVIATINTLDRSTSGDNLIRF